MTVVQTGMQPMENCCPDLLNDECSYLWRGVSALRVYAYIWIPIVVIASLILAAPIAWLIAPRLQARYDRRHTQ
jgi:hypothetical protein